MPLQTAEDLKKGDVFAGKYRIERVIGVGGMGVVAAAQHLELGTLVAVKFLLSEAAGSDEAIERFAREARAASRLRGEHAIHVYDVGKHSDGTPFMVMELLVGDDLGSLLSAHGAFDVSMAVGYVLQACEAIAEAHSIGIVHRDVKPTNLFLTQRVDGSPLVKVLDFGIAKRVESQEGTSLTGALIVGSPSYMSPEQMRGSSTVGTRSDIWSIGVCLYELVTGVLPFGGDSPLETCAVVMKDEPAPPTKLRPEIPPAFAQIVMRCLRKDPAERFQDIGALAEALEPFAPPWDRGATLRIRRVLRTPGAVNGSLSSSDLAPTQLRGKSGAAENGRSRRRWLAWLAAAMATVGLAAAAALWIAPRTAARTARSLAPSPAAAPLEKASSEVPVPSVPLEPQPPTVTWESIPPTPRALQTRRLRPTQAQQAEASPATARPHDVPTTPTGAVVPSGAPNPQAPVAAAPMAITSFSAPLPFAIESARVQLGTPVGVIGTTATNVSRALAKVVAAMTACYRAALPQMRAPFDGTGMLHLETNEEGVIVGAQLAGPLAGAVGSCIAASTRGRVVPSVDTGRARADVPLTFTAR